MKRLSLFPVLAIALTMTAGCQIPQSAPKYQCPPPSSTAWAPLNPVGSTSNPPIPSLTYVDHPTVGEWCYDVLAYDPVSTSPTYQMYSLPSNMTMIAFAASNTSVTNTWGASSTSGVVYVMLRAAALLVSPPGAPTLNSPTIAENNPQPVSTQSAPKLLAMLPAPARNFKTTISR